MQTIAETESRDVTVEANSVRASTEQGDVLTKRSGRNLLEEAEAGDWRASTGDEEEEAMVGISSEETLIEVVVDAEP
jgi:hypothetical protein